MLGDLSQILHAPVFLNLPHCVLGAPLALQEERTFKTCACAVPSLSTCISSELNHYCNMGRDCALPALYTSESSCSC